MVGVADGVGGWAEIGIDSGLFSRELMHNANSVLQEFNRKYGKDAMDTKEVLCEAFRRTKSMGTSTACLIGVNSGRIVASNLGDSGFCLLRRDAPFFGTGKYQKTPLTSTDSPVNAPSPSSTGSSRKQQRDSRRWRLVYQTTEQTHYFNCPFQLGTNSQDKPQDAQYLSVPCQRGDLIVAATDGLFDNMFIDELIHAVELTEDNLMKEIDQEKDNANKFANENRAQSPSSVTADTEGIAHVESDDDEVDASMNMSTSDDEAILPEVGLTGMTLAGFNAEERLMKGLSQRLSHLAFQMAQSETRRSPFAVNAAAAGFEFQGGKMDDITIVCSLIV